MKKILIAALAATTALTGVMSAGVAAAQPGYGYDRGQDRNDQDQERNNRDHGDRGDRGDHGDRNHGDRADRVDRWQRRDWDRDRERWSHGGFRYYGGHYGYNGYQGRWREGQRYPYWRNDRYVINDWRAYRLPPPRPGYRYYRDDNGDIVMAAVASGMIGLIIGSALSH